MTPDRWRAVKDLMDAALNVSPPERTSFVQLRAGDDEELRLEVLSLLESHAEAGDFLDSPVLNVDSVLETEDPAPALAGTRIGAYELIREIGRGGMGTVYLAVRADSEFRTEVAVKLIRGGMENQFVIRRFRNERQILARLEHPHIARLLDGGTTADGFPYFVMEFVQGEPLIAHCESHRLEIRRRLEIFLNVCSAVEYAHRRLIIHRDLKPGNILVTQEGAPKLLDFGIAKILDPEPQDDRAVTYTGLRLVTPAYGSPEQMRGEPATVRGDLYSLGVVLWELVTGRRWRGEDGKSSFDTPPRNQADDLLVRSIRNIVLRATCENPEDRYESVAAFAADIASALAGSEIPLYASAPPQHRDAPQAGSIAILPFHMLGADLASEGYLGLGIADALITRLSNIGRIAVRPTGAIAKFFGETDAIAAGRELNVQYVLDGRLRRADDRVRITIQLVEVRAGTPIWADSFDEPFEDFLKLEDSISARVAQALIPQMTGDERRQLARPGTASAKAHQAYLRGRWFWSQHTEEALPQALVLFTEAATEDPDYARAHAGIADYHIAIGIRGLMLPKESFAAAIVSARRAIELDPKLAEAHASLGLALWVRDGDFETATHHLQLAIALNPDLVAAHDWLGLLNASRRKPEMAIASIKRAQQLEPHSRVYSADLAFCHYNARRFHEAVAAFGPPEGGKEVYAPPVVNGAILPLGLLALGDFDRALRCARRFAEETSRNALALAVLAQAEAASGDPAVAENLRDEIQARTRDYYVPGVAVALAELACGGKRRAVRALEQACRDGDLWTLFLRQMPVWDPLRPDPRFRHLLEPHGKAAPVFSVPAPTVLTIGGSRMLWWAAAIVVLLAILAFALYIALERRIPS